jgi:hypothetical protein
VCFTHCFGGGKKAFKNWCAQFIENGPTVWK